MTTNDPPRLLFLCQTLPYPPDGGVWIRTYHVLRLLAEHFSITGLCFERAIDAANGMHHDVQDSLRALREFADVEAFPLPQRHSRARFVWDHLRSMARGLVYTEFLYDSRSFRRRLTELLATEDFDLIHVDSLDLSGYLPALEGPPRICVHHNIESQLLLRRSEAEHSWVRRRYVRLQADLMRKTERQWCPRMDLNVAVSAADAAGLKEIAAGGRYEVIPNGVDVEFFHAGPASTGGLVYVGSTQWFPNRDALDYFCADILPALRTRTGPVPVQWVGSASGHEQVEFREKHGVELTGYVPDIRTFVQDARCYIVPLRVGGGSRLKILDAWAMGKAVVSTSVGCEGLDARHGDNILIADTPAEFIDAISTVLTNDDLRARLGAAARETVERDYSWSVIGRRMARLYQSLLTESRTSGGAARTTTSP